MERRMLLGIRTAPSINPMLASVKTRARTSCVQRSGCRWHATSGVAGLDGKRAPFRRPGGSGHHFEGCVRLARPASWTHPADRDVRSVQAELTGRMFEVVAPAG
jgi:hypothetical protein